jgi:hypothetical protein
MEVVVSLLIATVIFGGIITGYMQGAWRAEYAGLSLAAQGLAIQQIEQAKSAVWDTSIYPPKCEITNLNLIGWSYTNGAWTGYGTNVMDLPVSGTNILVATNYVTVASVTNFTTPLVTVYMVRVDVAWPFTWKTTTTWHTNTVATYFAPD